MKKTCLLLLSALVSAAGFSQSGKYWNVVSQERAASMGEVKTSFAQANDELKFVTVNTAQLQAALNNAPQRWSGAQGVVITIPNVNGAEERFTVFEASNFSPALQAQYPGIRSYAGNGVDDSSAHLRISVSQKGIQTMVLRSGGATEFIEPYTAGSEVYAVFHAIDKRPKSRLPFTCTTVDDHALERAAHKAVAKSALSDDQVFRTMRLALSVTGEYTTYHGGTVEGALAAMNATMSRVNGIYEVDLAVNLIMIDNEADIIYTDSSSDPYSNASSMDNWNSELQANLTANIGDDNYDIGHLFGATGGGGNAGCIGCICESGKGSGITSPADGNPEGDNFDVDYVAHEMGHQMGAYHTFSYYYEGSGSQTEPGSGSTIMGYAGITGDYDIQAHSDAYFTYASLEDILEVLQNADCPVTTSLSNADFTVDAGLNYSIPKGTAFVLTAQGTENNPANVTYTWEQDNSASSSATYANSLALPTKTAGAIFRSVAPSTTPERYFPEYNSVLANTLTTTWETVSNVGRTLAFTLTGRDNAANGGQTKTDAVNIFVRSAAGPFLVTSQTSEEESWAVGSQQTITWDVAGTTANNVNTANVSILLSTDGGQTWAYTLAETTANDGSETITVPSGTESTNCRIMVKAVDNVYYAINTATFPIGYSIVNNCQTYTNDTGFSIPDNSSSYTTQTVTVTDVPENVTDVKVHVNLTHSYVSDLLVGVQDAGNHSLTLWNRQCTSNEDMDVTFDDNGAEVVCASPTTGTYAPSGTLANLLNYDTLEGDWKLRVRDTQSQDTGSVVSWSVELCSRTVQALGVEGFGLNGFAVYPNPSSGSFTVSFSSESNNKIEVLVHDIRGRVVYDNQFTNTGLFSGNVNLQSAQQGVYMVTVLDGARKETRKIVVQ